jgi:NAD(P)-dependent dehydrogenase (short-subunit alcohol dehydrogenase family)
VLHDGPMKRVLITAGASGIGREIVRAFAREGARVAVVDVDVSALAALAHELPEVISEPCDVGDLEALERVVPRCIEAFEGLDVLVNNAGIGGPTSLVENYPATAWEQVLRVNLTGTFNVSRLAIPHLRKSDAGCIINMSSAAGRLGYPMRSAYAASKWGIVGLTKTLSMELGVDGIRVNAILPGAVAGPRMDRVLEGRASQSGRSLADERLSALGNQSLKRFAEGSEVAAMALYLASDAARSISGQTLCIDGDMQRSA